MLEAVEASPEELLASSAAIETDDPYTSTAAYAMLGIDRSGELSPPSGRHWKPGARLRPHDRGSAGGPGLLTVRTDRPVTEHLAWPLWSVDHVLYGGESGRADGTREPLRSALGELPGAGCIVGQRAGARR